MSTATFFLAAAGRRDFGSRLRTSAIRVIGISTNVRAAFRSADSGCTAHERARNSVETYVRLQDGRPWNSLGAKRTGTDCVCL